ncbi:MAG: hypothetical protein WD771_01440 [Gemmatimonadaceae bacterium]
MRRAVPFAGLIVVIAASACGSDAPPPPPPPRDAAQQRAIDSTIGASGLPGAQGVRGALAASDSAARRARELDSLSRIP